jgi:hypothetical protein
MRQLIKYVKASAVLQNLFVGKHCVPKSWLSMDDLHETDMEDELDEELFLSEHMNATHGNEGIQCAEVHNFLRAQLQ